MKLLYNSKSRKAFVAVECDIMLDLLLRVADMIPDDSVSCAPCALSLDYLSELAQLCNTGLHYELSAQTPPSVS